MIFVKKRLRASHTWLHNFEWGDLDENGNYKEGKLVMHGQKNVYQYYLNEMVTFKGKPIMDGYRTSHGGDLNENDNFNL